MSVKQIGSGCPYKASITREPFLFYEMRTTAKLMMDGLPDDEIVQRIVAENLFQYPTERSVKRMANACVKRLRGMDDMTLVNAIATKPMDVSRQVCLYAMMKEHRLISDFMLTVIGEKYRTQEFYFSRKDLNLFFFRLQEQNDTVAGWTDGTIGKIKQVLTRMLVECEYLDTIKSTQLNPVTIAPELEDVIRADNDLAALPAFNCFR